MGILSLRLYVATALYSTTISTCRKRISSQFSLVAFGILLRLCESRTHIPSHFSGWTHNHLLHTVTSHSLTIEIPSFHKMNIGRRRENGVVSRYHAVILTNCHVSLPRRKGWLIVYCQLYIANVCILSQSYCHWSFLYSARQWSRKRMDDAWTPLSLPPICPVLQPSSRKGIEMGA